MLSRKDAAIAPPDGYRLLTSGDKTAVGDKMFLHGAWIDAPAGVRIYRYSILYARPEK